LCGVARSLKVLEPPPPHKDVTDLLLARGDLADLVEEGAKPMTAVVYGAALAVPLPPIDWLCTKLKLTTGSPTLVAGNAYSGKSLAMADLALAVATGGDAWGVFQCRRGRALMLDYDGQGRRISQERLQRLARARGVDLAIVNQAIGYARRPCFYLDDGQATDGLLALLDGYALCVVDSWRGATPNTDEWRRGPVQVVGDGLELVSTKTGCVIVVIDHNVKPARDGKSDRSAMHDVHGSTAKTEMAQSHFAFEGEQGGQLTRVKHVKERMTGQEIAPFALRFEDVEQDGDRRWGLRVTHVDRAEAGAAEPAATAKFDALKQAIVDLVRDYHGDELTSGNAICERVAVGSRQARLQAIRELVHAGRLAQPDGGVFRVVR
jgi:hypothetical protein